MFIDEHENHCMNLLCDLYDTVQQEGMNLRSHECPRLFVLDNCCETQIQSCC